MSAPPDGGELDDGFQVPFRINRRRRDMTVAAVHLSGSVQTLIDSRLDTIDRMLLGRLSRQDRLAIVRGGGVADLRAHSGARA